MQKKNHSQPDTRKERALRLLLIEDSDTDAFIIGKALDAHMAHAVCRRVGSMAEGEEILRQGETDAVLLDLGLPDTPSPRDTYARIKPWAQKMPVIIMTSLKDHDLARIMVHEGAADFLNKDIIIKDARRVREAIDFSLERHALQKKLSSDKERAEEESKQKDTLLSCFMGGYSISDQKKDDEKKDQST